MSIRRAFQVITFVAAFVLAMSVPTVTASACDPSVVAPGLC